MSNEKGIKENPKFGRSVNIRGLTPLEHSKIKYAAALKKETMNDWASELLLKEADAVINQLKT